MWLLNVETRKLEFFLSERAVSGGYAILSHTWGKDEMTFDDIQRDIPPEKRGYNKIELTCGQAIKDGYNYAWIDTVCIDKRSSAELTEAINSMYKWYRAADICYVYLEDVELVDSERSVEDFEFRNSRWFTRSWTLQELIAPRRVEFYDRQWKLIGDKSSLQQMIHETTRIDEEVLKEGRKLPHTSVAKRMSWAAMRSASRDEDVSYSLLGLFDVSMPLLYGEGGYKAFRRLQEEILRTGDHSILAWQSWDQTTSDFQATKYSDTGVSYALNTQNKPQGVLSPSPYGFRHAHHIVSWISPQPEIVEVSHHDLTARLLALDDKRELGSLSRTVDCRVALNCRYETEPWTHIVLRLKQRPLADDLGRPAGNKSSSATRVYDRQHIKRSLSNLESINFSEVTQYCKRSLTLAKQTFRPPRFGPFVHVTYDNAVHYVAGSYPPKAWDKRHCILTLQVATKTVSAGNVAAGLVQTTESAILLIRDHKGLISDTSAAAIAFTTMITVPSGAPSATRAYPPSPSVAVLPWDQYSTPSSIPESSYRSICDLTEPQLFSIHKKPALLIDSKVISVSGEMLWSFHISRAKTGHIRQRLESHTLFRRSV